ncbi:MAG: hypothetical protein IJE08_04440 [Clostridia bacterium]|nr:hypothetical protein [Clostridia bacterium]
MSGNPKQRLTLNNLNEPQQLRELNRQLTWIWDQLLGGLSMKSLNEGARAVIDSKAGIETVNELGETVAQHSTQFTQTETEIRSVAQSVTKLGETVTSQGTAIEQNSEQISLKANKGDPATGLDNEAGVVINANGVYVSGGEISLATSDGSEYVNVTGEGVSASGISAPNVMPRYAGPASITVNPNATDAQVKAGTHVRSLQSAAALVNGRYLDYDVTITYAAGAATYGSVEFAGIYGRGNLTIDGYSGSAPVLYGSMTVRNCGAGIIMNYVSVIAASGMAMTIQRTAAVELMQCTVKSASGIGISVGIGGDVYASSCVVSGSSIAGFVMPGGKATFLNTTGTGKLRCQYGVMIVSGTAPSGGAEWINTLEPNNSGSLTTDGTDGSGSAASTSTEEYLMTGSASYAGGWSYFGDDDPRQGYVSGGGRIRGCIWFSSALKTALSGKTIRQATLRLHQLGSYGRGVSVGVQLYGTTKAYSASLSGAPALTKSYGTIGTAEPGQSIELTIPTSVISDLVSGAISGLMLYSEDAGVYKDRDYSKNYARFSTEDGQQPRLTVVYS